MFNRLNSNNNIETNRSNKAKEKVASTIAAVALACGCAVGLSGCNDKNNDAAKSPEPSVSETTTTDSKNDFNSEIDDAGLNFKTIHSDVLDMDITIPEQAELLIKGSEDLQGIEVTRGGEEYTWQMGDIYYQVSVDRWRAEKPEKCPSENSVLYNKLLEKQETDPDNFYKLGDRILFFYSDWSAVIGKMDGNDCAINGEIRAGEELIDLGVDGKAMVDGSYYDRNGIDDSKRQTIRPIVRAVAKHLLQSIDAAN